MADMLKKVDVVTVGVGFAGSIVLAECAKAGLSVVGLELGYILIYRAGWKVSVASLVANLALACILVLVGVLWYKEVLTGHQILGIGACVVGILLISR